MTHRIQSILVSAGPETKIFKKGRDFDEVHERKTQQDSVELTLFKNGRLSVFIHPAVAIMIFYE
jgi:hypothetical protein